ncbi:type II CRISPR-associated endonuclease Cas1 [Vibrio campbellii]
MGWRTVMISNAAALSLHLDNLRIKQKNGTARVPLEDICAIILDCPEIQLSAPLLSACAANGLMIITVDHSHIPNGILLPFNTHSRVTSLLHSQIDLSKPNRKRLHQTIIKQKIKLQSDFLTKYGCNSTLLNSLHNRVRSGDPDNLEAQAARYYFKHRFGKRFRRREISVTNSALNYTYSILRSAIARSLVAYGLEPSLGLFHRNQLNSFNLADDLIEVYRPFADDWTINHLKDEFDSRTKQKMIQILSQEVEHNDASGATSIIASIDRLVISLQRIIKTNNRNLTLSMPNNWHVTNDYEPEL